MINIVAIVKWIRYVLLLIEGILIAFIAHALTHIFNHSSYGSKGWFIIELVLAIFVFPLFIYFTLIAFKARVD